MYNDIVWAKLGSYRFWPALILPPNKVPDNLMDKVHNRNQFCIKFFGSLDFSWINRGNVFIYQSNDADKTSKSKSGRMDAIAMVCGARSRDGQQAAVACFSEWYR